MKKEIDDIDIKDWNENPITQAVKKYITIVIEETLEEILTQDIFCCDDIISLIKHKSQWTALHILQDSLSSVEDLHRIFESVDSQDKKGI